MAALCKREKRIRNGAATAGSGPGDFDGDVNTQHGLVYNVQHLLKKPGAYQLRIAVRDAQTERVGSATQFIEAPDLKKGRLTLSGIIMWALNDATAKALAAAAPAGALAEGRVQDPDTRGGPAVRLFHPGGRVVYGFEIYNARTDRKTRAAAVETQMRLFRDNKEIWSGPVKALSSDEQTGPKAMGASGLLRLGSRIEPGEYIPSGDHDRQTRKAEIRHGHAMD